MVTKELLKYVKICREKGFSDLEIRNVLIEKGWSEKDVLEAILARSPKHLPKAVSLAGLIFVVLLVAAVIWAINFMLNDIRKISSEIAAATQRIHKSNEPQDNVKTYKNEILGFEVKYPADIFQLDTTAIALKHTLKNFHKYSLADGSDLGPADDIKIVFKKDIAKCDEYENTLKEIAGPFIIENWSGVKYEMGAEGEGVVIYCIKDSQDKNIFLIERYFLNEAYSLNLADQPDYIFPADQEKLFDRIISTFRFLEDFCGTSTNGQCSSDADCMTGGCSGQVCQSKSERPAITTCEWRDCYNSQAYGVSCGCVANKCQWK